MRFFDVLVFFSVVDEKKISHHGGRKKFFSVFSMRIPKVSIRLYSYSVVLLEHQGKLLYKLLSCF